jgi:hypothetical protein
VDSLNGDAQAEPHADVVADLAGRLLKIDIVARQPHHEIAARALASGLRLHGASVVITPSIEGETPIAACWGWKIGRRIAAQGRRVLVMELGYVGDRHGFTSLAWDGLNGRGNVPAVEDGGARWRRMFAADVAVMPWKKTGDCVVIMGQVPDDASIAGVDIESWYAQAIVAARRFGLPVYFRKHPLADHAPAGVDRLGGPLAMALARAAVVITFNSNAGVDAVLAGVPTIACDAGSMVWSIAGQGLQAAPPRPDRDAWCARIAWRQWTRAEIESGEAWDFLRLAI